MKKKRILIIDDSKVDITALLKILDNQYTVEIADNGSDGLMILEDGFEPDLILLDVMMPGMSGFEVCKRISENKNTADIPIIMITARTHANDIHEGLGAGAIDYIKKPFSEIELMARIRAVLRLRHYITMLKQANHEKQRLINELKDASAHIKTLSDLLPICSNCRRVRDDQGYWEQVDEYIQKHSDVQFSHSLCPDCIKELYPNLKIKHKDKEKP